MNDYPIIYKKISISCSLSPEAKKIIDDALKLSQIKSTRQIKKLESSLTHVSDDAKPFLLRQIEYNKFCLVFIDDFLRL